MWYVCQMPSKPLCSYKFAAVFSYHVHGQIGLYIMGSSYNRESKLIKRLIIGEPCYVMESKCSEKDHTQINLSKSHGTFWK